MNQLYIRSEYSFLNSTIKISELIKKLKANEVHCAAIADDGLFGSLKFFDALVKENIKPIIGARIYIKNVKNVFVCFCKNQKGYENLSHLLTILSQGALDDELVKKYSDGLIFVIPVHESVLGAFLENGDFLKAGDFLKHASLLFPDLYLGVDLITEKNVRVYNYLLKLNEVFNKRIISFHKTSFFKEDIDAFSVLKSIKENNNVLLTEEEKKMYFLEKDDFLKTFGDNVPLLEKNENELIEKINFTFSNREYKLPKYNHKEPDKFLESLAITGLKLRLKNKQVNEKVYIDRLYYELDIIKKLGFSDYFLIVYDFILYAKKHKILVGPGRGSAPSSLVSYCIGITDIDPIVYGLYFERFLNPERKNFPDIDTDFPDDKRDLIIEYLARKYTKTRVAKITTFGSFALRMAVRDAGKALGITKEKLEIILKYIPLNAKKITDATLAYPELIKIINSDNDIQNLFTILEKLIGLPRHVSTHAAGIIIADQNLDKYTPLILGSDGIYQTHLEAEDLEKIGLVKIDILGIRNLTIIDKVRQITNPNLNFSNLLLNDEKTFALIRNMDTDGIFQLESNGMRNVLNKIKTQSFEDICLAIALFRPGPMENIPLFIERKVNKKPFTIEKALKPILDETYGIIVYQEQIIRIAHEYAKMSLGEADKLRAGISKKNERLINESKDLFIKQSLKQNHELEVSQKIFAFIKRFANYGFNKSHSVAYAMVSYFMAYLKVNYYREFMAVMMTYNMGSSDFEQYINTCRKNKIMPKSPDVQISTDEFIIKDRDIYLPLTAVKNLGTSACNAFLKARKEGFSSLEDFINKTKVNELIYANLVFASALDSFGYNKKTLIENYEILKNAAKFSSYIKPVKGLIKPFDEYSKDYLQEKEYEVLGFNLKYSDVERLNELYQKYNLKKLLTNNRIGALFVIKRSKMITTKLGEEMALISLQNEDGLIKGVAFPKTYLNFKNKIILKKIVYITGEKQLKDGHNEIIINTIDLIE